jgi:hypothetical protein
MTRPDSPIIDPRRLGDSFGAWRENLAVPLAKLQADVRTILSNGLLRKDNSLCALVDLGFTNSLQLTSGVERLIANPLAGKGITPIGFTPWYAEDANGNPLTISGWKFNQRPTDTNGTKLPGMVGLTVNFDLAHTQPYLEKYLNANQSIANGGATTAVLWDATAGSRGTGISYNAGTFTLAEAGTYQIVSSLIWQTGVTYTIAEGALYVTGSLLQTKAGGTPNSSAHAYLNLAWADGPWHQFVGQFQVAAGATFSVQAAQTNGAAAARNLRGVATDSRAPSYVSVARLYNDTAQQGRVIGVLEVG